jgi:NAD(P)-dependent dehydrogenase (short-subunit alcohol dehydrogenase family)
MVAVVIGAAGTIGEACVAQFREQGHSVIAVDLTAPSLEGATAIAMDVTDRDSVREVLSAIDERAAISALVYAAGLNTTGPLDVLEWSDYDRVMAVNLQGAFHVAAQLETLMKKTPRSLGAVFISSTAGLRGEPGGSVYVASKFGLRGLVESFAAEIAPLGGRANTVCPGNVDSVMLVRLAEKFAERQGASLESVMGQLAAGSAFNRLITPSEVAQTCVWLCSGAASGISGQTIVVDGAPV